MSKARDLANAGTALTTVSATELGYLDGVTSAVQTQIDSKIGQSTAINPTIVDAKGDLIVGSAADTVIRKAVGTNGQLLYADSTATGGIKWDAAPSSTLTLSSIASGNFNSGTSLTISGLTQDFLQLHIYGITTTTATNIQLVIKPNNDGSGLCDYVGGNQASGSTITSVRTQNGVGFRATSASAQGFGMADNYYIITFQNCKASGFTTFSYTSGFTDNGGSTANAYGSGIFKSASQLTSINIAGQSGQTFNGTGTYAIYGA